MPHLCCEMHKILLFDLIIAVGLLTDNQNSENLSYQKEERLSYALANIAHQIGEREVKFKELINITQGRGYDLLLVLLSLPFLTPISLVGISTPFGLAIAFVGLRMSLGKKPWWPKKLLERTIPPSFFPKLLKVTIHICKAIEFFSRPRVQIFHNFSLFKMVSGLLIAISGILLALPLPIPFSNTLPAVTILLFAISAMKRDGLIFIIAGFSFILMIGYFAMLIFGGVEIINIIKNHNG